MTLELMGGVEAAEYLKMDRATLSRHTHAGRIQLAHQNPGIRGSVMYLRTEVERYAAERAELAAIKRCPKCKQEIA